ncbi:ankyrin repeat protein [Podospora aff. communis PSN243]|uniref:Ankyrin repeat protein n=1 Tax=Podospora aff. communis PSN243 TaxID=3040156 RepID=A0AAV9G3P6_9PEZI|nr:ankyrin repeat protein [Podospora aff. communis PSN243]
MSENHRAFRISGIPAELDSAATRSVVRSLGPHPQTGYTVAIVTFSETPHRLRSGTSWELVETVKHSGKSLQLHLEIDANFLGFTPTNTPEGDEDNRVDCIAISGLSSHPFGSWKKRGGRFTWLVDDVSVVPPNVRMLLYGYNTSLVASESFQNVADIGQSLAADVQGIQPSLGGLVVKEAICHMARINKGISQCVYGLVFFGVPHRGLLVEPWLQIVDKRPNEQLITALKPESCYLRRLTQDFGEVFTHPKSQVVSVYETMKTRYLSMNRSHDNLPKFTGFSDEDYLRLQPYLQNIWKKAVADVRERFEATSSEAEAEESLEDTRGLVQLWPAEEAGRASTKPPTEFDIIAIHGLGGHTLETWKAGRKVWLRDMLPLHPSLAKARVLSFGYDSELTFLEAKLNTLDTAKQLLESIWQLRGRKSDEGGRKMIFVCHSVGGILFKHAFNLACRPRGRHHSLSKSVAGVIFLGSPHISHCENRGNDDAGSRARWANIFDKLTMAATSICSLFDENSVHLNVFSFYKRHCLKSVDSLVVDRSFAILHLPHETTLPLSGDHESISKYLTSSCPNYSTVCGSIEELLESPMSREVHLGAYHDKDQANFISILGLTKPGKDWLSGPKPWGTTSRWFHEHPDFISWTSLRGVQVLWIHGQPGSGKSVLMRSTCQLLDDQPKSTNDPIVRVPIRFFFDDKDATQNESERFVRSVLHQILSGRNTSSLIGYLDASELKRQATTEDGLWECLSTIVRRSHGFVFQFIVDAVDEALRGSTGTSTTVIDRLQELCSLDSSGRVRLLISSRMEPPYNLSGTTDIRLVCTDNEATRLNVTAFVRSHVRTSLQRSHRAIHGGQDIEDKIIELSQGNFLFAKLAWEQFSRGFTEWSRDEIQRGFSRLECISPDLTDVYCGLLQTIPQAYVSRARASFAILRVSKEKLTPYQLAFMATLLTYSPGKGVTASDLPNLRLLAADFEAYLSEVCGFIVRRTKDGTVDFIHVSAKDVLLTDPRSATSSGARQVLSTYRVVDSDAHALLHTVCIEILRLEDAAREPTGWHGLWSAALETERRTANSLVTGQLLTPAGTRHVKTAIMSRINTSSQTQCLLYSIRHCDELHQNVVAFAQTVAGYYSHLLWTRLDADATALSRYRECHTTPGDAAEPALFRLVAQGDCPGAVEAHLAKGIKTKFIPHTGHGLTILSWTIVCQRKQAFDVLVRNSAVLANYGLPSEMKPLHYAAECHDTHYLVRLLRLPDIDINVKRQPSDAHRNETSGSPLHTAITAKNVPAVQILLSQPKIDVWATQGGRGSQTAYSRLFQDSVWGPVVPDLLRVGSQTPTSGMQHISSQLRLAGLHGWTEVEDAILRTDALQLLAVDGFTGLNTLEENAYFGRKQKLLWYLDRLPGGFPLRSVLASRYDLLHLCAHQQWEDVVRLLQGKYGLTSLASDHVGRSLLHWVVEYSWALDVAKFHNSEYVSLGLLDLQDRDGLTALHIAVMNHNSEVVRLLDKKGMSPAHLAAETGFREALNLFISTGRREFGRTNDGASLLHLMAMWTDGLLIRRFVLSKRALVNVVDKHRRTPLHYAAMSNNVSAVQQLISLGASVDMRDENDRTALHEAIRGDAVAAASILLELGANPKFTDFVGQNCLHLSVRYGADSLFPRLLELGVDINAVDSFGMRPIHRACSTGDV